MSCAITRRRLPALRTLPSSTVLTLSCSPTRRMSWFLPLNANADVRAATRNAWILVSALMISSAMPSVKYSFSGSALMFTNGSTAIDLVLAAAWAGACSACESCAAVGKRSAGSFASAFFTACAVQSGTLFCRGGGGRSEEHTSELQSLRHLLCRLLLGSEEHTSELQSLRHLVCRLLLEKKSTSLNSTHLGIFHPHCSLITTNCQRTLTRSRIPADR